MALIECIECGKKISDRANTCPNCGNPMFDPLSEPFQKQQPKIEIKEHKEGCFLQTLNFGCMIFFIIIGLMILIAIFG